MATIKKRGEYSWNAQIRKKGFPSQSKTFQTKGDAEKWARQIEAEMDRGIYLPRRDSERMTFGELAKRFSTEFAPHHYRGPAWKHKLAQLKAKLDSYSLAALTPQLVAKFRDDRLKEPDGRYKLDRAKVPCVSPATVKTEIDLLSKILDVAQKEFGIALPNGNPVAGVRKPRGGNARDRRLNKDEWEVLMRECRASQNTWLAPAVVLAVETAMRQGEILSLKWCDIDKGRRLALLRDPQKIKNEEARAVPLSSVAIRALEGLPRNLTDRLIPVDRMTLYKAFERACKRASVENLTFHDLRHEALSRLAERGDFSVLEMAAVSGHKTLQMLKRYTHLQAESLARKLG